MVAGFKAVSITVIDGFLVFEEILPWLDSKFSESLNGGISRKEEMLRVKQRYGHFSWCVSSFCSVLDVW